MIAEADNNDANGATSGYAYLMCVRAHGNTKCARQTKVCELQVIVFVDEQILWLEIAVEDAVCMAVKQARRQLMREFLDMQSMSASAF